MNNADVTRTGYVKSVDGVMNFYRLEVVLTIPSYILLRYAILVKVRAENII